ncbi:unnamed protein product, partial [Ixodes persulcatus]
VGLPADRWRHSRQGEKFAHVTHSLSRLSGRDGGRPHKVLSQLRRPDGYGVRRPLQVDVVVRSLVLTVCAKAADHRALSWINGPTITPRPCPIVPCSLTTAAGKLPAE